GDEVHQAVVVHGEGAGGLVVGVHQGAHLGDLAVHGVHGHQVGGAGVGVLSQAVQVAGGVVIGQVLHGVRGGLGGNLLVAVVGGGHGVEVALLVVGVECAADVLGAHVFQSLGLVEGLVVSGVAGVEGGPLGGQTVVTYAGDDKAVDLAVGGHHADG